MLEWKVPVHQESIIKVIGVGGGGSNAVNYMFSRGIRGVEFVICNTDIQALRNSPVRNRIQIGKTLTEGRGAGSDPSRGKESAIEDMEYLRSMLERNTQMVFITAGMGGGTGTGAAPVIAKLARELKILTIAIVTIPFHFEGKKRIEQAMAGVDELAGYVDALLIICNEKLRDMYGDLKLSHAFEMADNVLATAARSIAEIITLKGFVNVDFADVEVVMRNSGVALMGSGEAAGENRALDAVRLALDSPLLNSSDIRGTSNILLNLLYGEQEVTMDEITLITDYLKELVGYDVNVIWGAGQDETMGSGLRVSVIATGFHSGSADNRVRRSEFKVTPVEDLQMESEDPRELERQERLRKQQQEENRLRKMQQDRERKEELRREEARREELRREELRRAAAREAGLREVVWDHPAPASASASAPAPAPAPEKKRGINDIPDVETWFRRKFGGFFNEDMNRDREM